MLAARYIAAVEKQLEWLRWTKSPAGLRTFMGIHQMSRIEIDPLVEILSQGTTFYLEPHFSRLIDSARRTVPDDIAYDHTWLLAPRGFCVIGEPFEVPMLKGTITNDDPSVREVASIMRLSAVGWHPVPLGTTLRLHAGKGADTYPAGTNATRFVFFMPNPDPRESYEYTAWSYFVLHDGHTLGNRIAEYESNQAQHEPSSEYHGVTASKQLHEMRWLFTALHLMAQRLATTVSLPVDRATRRRAERTGQTAPPILRIVTLRRLREDQQKANISDRDAPDWQWQWLVEGHWRWQFYPSTGEHKRIFIEMYTKGPEDKPMKPKSLTLFVGKR